MSSSHELQDLFVSSYKDGTFNENDFSILHEEFMPKNPYFAYEEYNKFFTRREERCRILGLILSKTFEV